jgi:apolipoprotein N-acyltransferase
LNSEFGGGSAIEVPPADAASFIIRHSKFIIRISWPWLAAITSGVLLTLSFPPFDHGWLIWIALTPLLCAAWFRDSQARGWLRHVRAAGAGYVAGLVFFSGTFHWLGTLAELYGSPLLRTLPLLLALVLGGYVAAWTWFLDIVLVPLGEARRFPNSWRNLSIGALGACAWVALEWVRGWLFGGFGWNGLGVAMHRELAMIQIADITGVWGLSWLVAFSNLMAVIIVRRIVGEIGPVFLKRVRWEFSISVALVVVVFSYGVRALIANDIGPTIPLRVAAIQPNIAQREKFDPEAEEKTLETFDRLTALATLSQPAPQLVIWPESATPRALFADEDVVGFVKKQAARGDYGLLIGSTDFDLATGDDYNIAALFTERGSEMQIYRKMHLVPFGEYLPLRPLLEPIVGDLIPGDFTAGAEHTLLALADPAVRIGALVCFEDTLGDLTRRFVAGGAQLLVNVTNDGWFAQSPAAAQHLANALFLAVETRRPLVRCGNTGLTGSIDPFGRTARLDAGPRVPSPRHVVPFLKPFQQGFVSGGVAVPTANRMSFYTRHGDWLPIACAALSALACLRALRRAV